MKHSNRYYVLFDSGKDKGVLLYLKRDETNLWGKGKT